MPNSPWTEFFRNVDELVTFKLHISMCYFYSSDCLISADSYLLCLFSVNVSVGLAGL
jgi:hypothetical protein